jgi:hypothetical protein
LKNENKKLTLKITVAESDRQKQMEINKIIEGELVTKQERIKQLENDLKEAEKLQASIMLLMQKKK